MFPPLSVPLAVPSCVLIFGGFGGLRTCPALPCFISLWTRGGCRSSFGLGWGAWPSH